MSRLARKLGVSRAAIYVWLRDGHVSPSRAIQLEYLFKVPRDDLMDQRMLTLLKGSTTDALDSGALAYRPHLAKVE